MTILRHGLGVALVILSMRVTCVDQGRPDLVPNMSGFFVEKRRALGFSFDPVGHEINFTPILNRDPARTSLVIRRHPRLLKRLLPTRVEIRDRVVRSVTKSGDTHDQVTPV